VMCLLFQANIGRKSSVCEAFHLGRKHA
jgi:hypothetical protein